MWNRKRNQIREQASVIDQLLTQLAETRDEASANLYAAKRAASRFHRLHDRLQASRTAEDLAAEFAHATKVEHRLDRALRGAGRYLTALWAARRENVRLRKLLRRADEDRRALQTRLTQLQDANEAMCREAVDRAGTLAPRKAVSTP